MTGHVTDGGVYVEAGGALHRLPATPTPLAVAMTALLDAIEAGEVALCPYCHLPECECGEWIELMTAPPPADPHDDLSVFRDCDLPY